MTKPPTPSREQLLSLFHAMTAPCECCMGTGRRPLSRAEAETVGALDGQWRTTTEIHADIGDHIKGPAVANRLARLEDIGIAESRAVLGAVGQAKEWRLKP